MSVKDTTVVRVPNEILPQVNRMIENLRKKKKVERDLEKYRIENIIKSGLISLEKKGNFFIVNKDGEIPVRYKRITLYEKATSIVIESMKGEIPVIAHIIDGNYYITKNTFKEFQLKEKYLKE